MDKTKLAVSIVGGGMFLFLLYSFIVTNYFDLGYPYNTFLCSKIDSFMDFYNVNKFICNFRPYSPGKDVSYPPFALILAYPFSLFYNYSRLGPLLARESILGIISYVLLFSSFSWFLLKAIYHTIKTEDKFNSLLYTAILFLTYPVFYMFDRGNYIMITFIFVYFFVYYYNKNPKKSLYFLSAAIAMKIYPIIFVLIFVIERRYKDIWKTAFITGGFSLVPLFLFRGNFFSNLSNFVGNLLFFSKGHASEIQNLSWSSSLSGVIKIPIMLFNQGEVPYDIRPIYYLLVFVLVGIVLYLLKKEVKLDRKIVYLLALQILIMPISYDYALVFLYVPLLLLLKKERILEQIDYFLIIVIALLFIPKAYGILFHDWIWTVSIQSFITPVLLLSLIIYPFYKELSYECVLKKLETVD